MTDDATLRERLREASGVRPPDADLVRVARRGRRIRLRNVAAIAVSAAILASAVVVPLVALRQVQSDVSTGPAGPTRTVSGSGISAIVPTSWHARVRSTPGLGAPGRGGGVLEATTDRMPASDVAFGSVAWGRSHQRGDLWLWMQEVTAFCPCDGFPVVGSIPPFAADDWLVADPPGSDRETRLQQNEGGYLRPVTIEGRSFLIEALFTRRPAPPGQLAQVNDILASIRVAPLPLVWGLPPVTPVSFTPGRGRTAWEASGGNAAAWASTVAIDPRDLYDAAIYGTLTGTPTHTLGGLRDGEVVINASVWRPSHQVPGPPLRLSLGSVPPEDHWEGMPAPGLWRYRLTGMVGGHYADVSVYVTAHPSGSVFPFAQAMLRRLRFDGRPPPSP
jgi:hypothetical protein